MELEALNERYNSDKFEFFVIRGRRRVGKTRLLQEFCKDKNSIFYVCTEQKPEIQLQELSNIVTSYFEKDNAKIAFQDFESIFNYIYQKSKNERLIVVIDEFQYLASSEKSIMSVLQKLIDQKLLNSKIFLILCGSSISFMENEVVAYKAPLYGRITGQLKVKPLYFKECMQYMENYSNKEKVQLFSITGGIPQYLIKMNPKLTVEKNIEKNLLSTQSDLYEEPYNLLVQELREPAQYNSIIQAIALGATKVNEIATKTNMTSDKIATYLRKLLELQIVIKEIPITEKETSKKAIYKINDNLFKFWYKYVFANVTLIELGKGKILYKEIIKPTFNDYIGKIFEDICKEYFLINMDTNNVPFIFHKIGRWWGNNPKLKQEEEIDLLAMTNDEKKMFFIECKWKNEKIGIKVLEELKRKANLFENCNDKYYGICSKSGFTKELLDYSKEHKNIYLYDLDKICK